MTKALERLCSLGGHATRDAAVSAHRLADAFGKENSEALRPLLDRKNGFYAFESALRVYPDLGTPNEKGIIEWNDQDLWRGEYDGLADGGLFFAEDVFGGQFCLKDQRICTFDPETGAFETMASDLEDWAGKILDDFSLWTGHQLGHTWQLAHGTIPAGFRLLPKIPFVLGGEFSNENLHAIEAVRGMKFRASIAVQIRDLPDGAEVVLASID
jgi:hypothetical protein